MIIREERIGACRRVDEATRQADLFVATPAPQPMQEVLL